MSKKDQRQKALEIQIARLERNLEELQALSQRFSWYRLFIILTGAIFAFIAANWLPKLWIYVSIGLSIGLFSIIVYYHRRIDHWLRKYMLWSEIKTHQLARIQLDWEKLPSPRQSSRIERKPLGVDLDLTGRRSLHQLIDVSVSLEGSRLLSEWLTQPEPDPTHIYKYQNIVRELVPLIIFRDKLLLNFRLTSKDQLGGKQLLKWLKMPYPSKEINRLLPLSSILVALNISLFVLNILGYIPSYWIISSIIYLIFYFVNQGTLRPFLEAVVLFDMELDKFKAILVFLEKYPYGDRENLAHLCQPFTNTTEPPSRKLKKIKFVTAAIGVRTNPVLMLLLNIVLPWDFYFSWLISRHREDLARQMPVWLNTLYKLEASISLANFAYINPEYSFPEFIADEGDEISPLLETTDTGHPLLPPNQKVCNDFSINKRGEVFIVTGSNMSGKSTFIKTIGINLCLAYAGGPVNASKMRTTFFRLHTCIRISDSITDGFSYFYAEVKCLKNLLNRTKSKNRFPLLFLIDEIYRGTNNRERLIGSRMYIQNIAGKSCVGLIATHDLELAYLADRSNYVMNYHFRDEVRGGKLVFDYKIRPGPSPTTNALTIMEIEGLPVG